MVKRQDGLAHLGLVLVAATVFAVVGAAIWRVHKTKQAARAKLTQNQVVAQVDQPLPLEGVGFNLDYYDPATNHAGDMVFTNVDHSLSGHIHQVWQDFGQQDYRSPNDPSKLNPQPTYVLPLHTKVHSLVTGDVVDVKRLYSNDYTIWVARSTSSHYTYETEHVDNPTVKQGDRVTGGQVVGEVSSKDSDITPGFGLLEIGILYTAHDYPQHLCPFKYLDPAIKADIGKKITALHAAWETWLGQRVYLQPFASPGCVTEEPVNG